MSSSPPRWSWALLTLAATATAAHSQSATTPPDAPTHAPATMDAVVVTASGFEQQVEDAPASITVIPGEELRRRSMRNLGDAVRDVEGVVVNGSANEADISIRGMPPDYTLILVDGKRQSGRDSRVNGNRGYEQSFVPPAAAIERIEVVRGPMSSLYGSDAMGGVINIITKKVANEWGGALTLDYTAQQHSDQGNSRQAQFYLSGPIKTDLLGLQAWGRYLDRQSDDDVERTLGYTKARHRDATVRLAVTPTVNQEFLFEAGETRLRNGNGLSPNWATRQQDNDRSHWSISNHARWGRAQSDMSISHEKTSRDGLATPDQTDVYGRKPEVENTVFDAKLVVPFANHIATGGVQWNQGKVHDWNQGLGDRKQYTFGVVQKAVFVEDEWAMTDRFSLTGGVRLDDHEQYGSHVSPRLYGVWRTTDNWTLKGGVSRGFKAPEIRAVVPGYAYLRRNTFVMLGNPDLDPETSTNYEVSAMWSNRDNLSAGATVFYNDVKDKLSTITTNDRWNGYRIMQRVNLDRAVIKGLELNGRWDVMPTVAIKTNYTYTDSKQKGGANAGAPLSLIPEHKANLRGEWAFSNQASVWTALNYYGKEYGTTIDGEPAPAYTTVDLGGSYDVSKNLTLNASLNNLTDKRLDDETYGTVNYGRNVWVSASITF